MKSSITNLATNSEWYSNHFILSYIEYLRNINPKVRLMNYQHFVKLDITQPYVLTTLKDKWLLCPDLTSDRKATSPGSGNAQLLGEKISAVIDFLAKLSVLGSLPEHVRFAIHIAGNHFVCVDLEFADKQIRFSYLNTKKMENEVKDEKILGYQEFDKIIWEMFTSLLKEKFIQYTIHSAIKIQDIQKDGDCGPMALEWLSIGIATHKLGIAQKSTPYSELKDNQGAYFIACAEKSQEMRSLHQKSVQVFEASLKEKQEKGSKFLESSLPQHLVKKRKAIGRSTKSIPASKLQKTKEMNKGKQMFNEDIISSNYNLETMKDTSKIALTRSQRQSKLKAIKNLANAFDSATSSEEDVTSIAVKPATIPTISPPISPASQEVITTLSILRNADWGKKNDENARNTNDSSLIVKSGKPSSLLNSQSKAQVSFDSETEIQKTSILRKRKPEDKPWESAEVTKRPHQISALDNTQVIGASLVQPTLKEMKTKTEELKELNIYKLSKLWKKMTIDLDKKLSYEDKLIMKEIKKGGNSISLETKKALYQSLKNFYYQCKNEMKDKKKKKFAEKIRYLERILQISSYEEEKVHYKNIKLMMALWKMIAIHLDKEHSDKFLMVTTLGCTTKKYLHELATHKKPIPIEFKKKLVNFLKNFCEETKNHIKDENIRGFSQQLEKLFTEMSKEITTQVQVKTPLARSEWTSRTTNEIIHYLYKYNGNTALAAAELSITEESLMQAVQHLNMDPQQIAKDANFILVQEDSSKAPAFTLFQNEQDITSPQIDNRIEDKNDQQITEVHGKKEVNEIKEANEVRKAITEQEEVEESKESEQGEYDYSFPESEESEQEEYDYSSLYNEEIVNENKVVSVTSEGVNKNNLNKYPSLPTLDLKRDLINKDKIAQEKLSELEEIQIQEATAASLKTEQSKQGSVVERGKIQQENSNFIKREMEINLKLSKYVEDLLAIYPTSIIINYQDFSKYVQDNYGLKDKIILIPDLSVYSEVAQSDLGDINHLVNEISVMMCRLYLLPKDAMPKVLHFAMQIAKNHFVSVELAFTDQQINFTYINLLNNKFYEKFDEAICKIIINHINEKFSHLKLHVTKEIGAIKTNPIRQKSLNDIDNNLGEPKVAPNELKHLPEAISWKNLAETNHHTNLILTTEEKVELSQFGELLDLWQEKNPATSIRMLCNTIGYSYSGILLSVFEKQNRASIRLKSRLYKVFSEFYNNKLRNDIKELVDKITKLKNCIREFGNINQLENNIKKLENLYDDYQKLIKYKNRFYFLLENLKTLNNEEDKNTRTNAEIAFTPHEDLQKSTSLANTDYLANENEQPKVASDIAATNFEQLAKINYSTKIQISAEEKQELIKLGALLDLWFSKNKTATIPSLLQDIGYSHLPNILGQIFYKKVHASHDFIAES